MAPIGLFFGTSTGNTQVVAEMIQEAFGADVCDLLDVNEASAEDAAKYNNIILGVATWNIGEIESCFDNWLGELEKIDFTGKKVAIFGLGDQIGYPDTFQDAMGMVAEMVKGGEWVGAWPTEGYQFTASKGAKDGKFIGLACDQDNQADKTPERVKAWVEQLKGEFGI